MNVVAAIVLVGGIGLLGWAGLGVMAILEGDSGGVMAGRFADVSDWMAKSGFGVAIGAGGYFAGRFTRNGARRQRLLHP